MRSLALLLRCRVSVACRANTHLSSLPIQKGPVRIVQMVNSHNSPHCKVCRDAKIVPREHTQRCLGYRMQIIVRNAPLDPTTSWMVRSRTQRACHVRQDSTHRHRGCRSPVSKSARWARFQMSWDYPAWTSASRVRRDSIMMIPHKQSAKSAPWQLLIPRKEAFLSAHVYPALKAHFRCGGP